MVYFWFFFAQTCPNLFILVPKPRTTKNVVYFLYSWWSFGFSGAYEAAEPIKIQHSIQVVYPTVFWLSSCLAHFSEETKRLRLTYVIDYGDVSCNLIRILVTDLCNMSKLLYTFLKILVVIYFSWSELSLIKSKWR